MKRTLPPVEGSRFKAQIRHYHRSAAPRESSWRQWVDGDREQTGNGKLWLRIGLAATALIAIGLVIAGMLHAGIK